MRDYLHRIQVYENDQFLGWLCPEGVTTERKLASTVSKQEAEEAVRLLEAKPAIQGRRFLFLTIPVYS